MEKQNPTLEEILSEIASEDASGTPEEPTSGKPSEETQARVSFVQTPEIDSMPMRVNVPSGQKPSEPERRPVIFSDDTPKIRRMSDSTRAREIAKIKKKNKKKQTSGKNQAEIQQKAAEELSYTRERPEGEYQYTQIHLSKKSKNRKKIKRTPDLNAAGTETIHLNLKDVVPVSQPSELEPVEPIEIEPAPRAEKTSLNLSDAAPSEAGDLDVNIKRSVEEAEAENRRRQEITDKMELENVADIRFDIRELRSAINFRIFALTVVLLLSGYMVSGEMIHNVWLDNLHPVMQAVLQTLLGAGAAVVCLPVLKNGFRRLVTFHADTDSVAATALTTSMISCVTNIVLSIMGKECIPYFLPCAVLALMLHTVGKLLIVNREQGNLRLVTKRFNCYGMTIVENEQRADALTRGVLGDYPILAAQKHTDSLIDFRKYTYSSDLADRFCRVAAPLTTIFAIVMSIVMTSLRAEGFAYCMTLLSMFTAASSCAAITFVVNLPLLRASRQMSQNGALLLGYQSVDDFYDTNSLMTDAASLFPEGSVKLTGVKKFTSARTEEILLVAASLCCHAGSVFGNPFREALQGGARKLSHVENYVYEDSMGLCGWIHNQRVLLGTRELMAAHNIEGMPSVIREAELVGSGNEAVYLSISGNLTAMFLVELHADRQVKFWAKQAVRHGICLTVRSVDPIVTIARLSAVLDIPQESLKIIPVRMHEDYAAETAPVEHMSASMASTGSFSNVMQLLVCTKVLRQAAMIGVFVQAVSVLLGLGIVMMEAVLRVGMTPMWMLALQLIVVVITILSVNIRKLY